MAVPDNANTVPQELEEMLIKSFPVAIEQSLREKTRHVYVFAFSAATIDALEALRQEHITSLQKITAAEPPAAADFKAYCFATTSAKPVLAHRVALATYSPGDLLDQLTALKLGDAAATPPPPIGDIIFAFPGQGSYFPSMARELMLDIPTVRQVIEKCDALLLAKKRPLIKHVFEQSNDAALAACYTPNTMDMFEAMQTAAFALEYALSSVWAEWGVVPTLNLGHSLGEIAAMTVSGILTMEEGLLVVSERANLISKLIPPFSSTLLVVFLSGAKATELITNAAPVDGSHPFPDVSVACLNGPHFSVLGGPTPQIHAFKEYANSPERNLRILDIPFPYGFHSKAMEPILEPLTNYIKNNVNMREPRIPFHSNTFHRTVTLADLQPSYFSTQARAPVDYVTQLQSMTTQGFLDSPPTPLVLEVGAKQNQLQMITHILAGRDILAVPSILMEESSWMTMCKVLAACYSRGFSINWEKVWENFTSGE